MYQPGVQLTLQHLIIQFLSNGCLREVKDKKKKLKSLISKSDDGRLREVVANKIISSTHDLALHTMKFRSSLQY